MPEIYQTLLTTSFIVALIMLFIVPMIPKPIPAEVKQARKETQTLVQEALAKGNFKVLHRNLSFKKGKPHERVLKAHLYLSNGTTLYFDSFDAADADKWDDCYFLVDPVTGKETDASLLKTQKTSHAIMEFLAGFDPKTKSLFPVAPLS